MLLSGFCMQQKGPNSQQEQRQRCWMRSTAQHIGKPNSSTRQLASHNSLAWPDQPLEVTSPVL